MALAKKHRLNLRLHRLRVESNCKKLHSPLFTYLIASSSSQSHFAILVSKKLAKKTVQRNKIKRQISQSIQNSFIKLPPNQDVILIPKPAILDKSVAQISQDIIKTLCSSVSTKN